MASLLSEQQTDTDLSDAPYPTPTPSEPQIDLSPTVDAIEAAASSGGGVDQVVQAAIESIPTQTYASRLAEVMEDDAGSMDLLLGLPSHFGDSARRRIADEVARGARAWPQAEEEQNDSLPADSKTTSRTAMQVKPQQAGGDTLFYALVGGLGLALGGRYLYRSIQNDDE